MAAAYRDETRNGHGGQAGQPVAPAHRSKQSTHHLLNPNVFTSRARRRRRRRRRRRKQDGGAEAPATAAPIKLAAHPPIEQLRVRN